MSATLATLGEEGLLQLLTGHWKNDRRVVVGVGDDCAVWREGKKSWLFKTDAVVEGVHFTARTPGFLIGRKALARAVSDVAAMGGQPLAALITLGLPRTTSVTRVRGIYRGLTALAQAQGVNLVGGETTRARQLFLSVALWGEMRAGHPVLRSTAQRGDKIWVTGTLGGTQRRKHLTFEPRVAEGQWLARTGWATSMMDLSDGLAGDLPRLAKASRLGFRVEDKLLPITPGASLRQAWQDGEDYELLFTSRAQDALRLQQEWKFKTRLTCIGEMIPAAGMKWKHGGYDHFA